MDDFAQQIFRDISDTNRAIGGYVRMGHERGYEKGHADAMADVLAWIERNRDANGMAHTESLLTLCTKEKK